MTFSVFDDIISLESKTYQKQKEGSRMNKKYILTNEQGEVVAEANTYVEALEKAEELEGNTFIDVIANGNW